jgi:hypothetical protein
LESKNYFWNQKDRIVFPYFKIKYKNLHQHPQIENISTFIFVCWTPKNFEKFGNENEKLIFLVDPGKIISVVLWK